MIALTAKTFGTLPSIVLGLDTDSFAGYVLNTKLAFKILQAEKEAQERSQSESEPNRYSSSQGAQPSEAAGDFSQLPPGIEPLLDK